MGVNVVACGCAVTDARGGFAFGAHDHRTANHVGPFARQVVADFACAIGDAAADTRPIGYDQNTAVDAGRVRIGIHDAQGNIIWGQQGDLAVGRGHL